MLAREVLIYHIVSYLVMILFLAGAARRREEALSPLAFIPFVQLYVLARVAELPRIVGVLLVMAMIAVKSIDYFYGFVSMARAADFLVIAPAYWYIWWRMIQLYGLKKWVFVLFVPIVTENLGYLLLGLGWLAGRRPFTDQAVVDAKNALPA